MGNQKLSDNDELYSKWFLPKKDVIRRDALIIEEWEHIIKSFPAFKEKIERNPVFPKKFISILAHLKQISDEMLLDAIYLNLDVFYINKSEKIRKEFNRKIEEILDKFFQVTKSKIYKKILVEREISGDDEFTIDGLKVKITQKAILQHIERIKAKPLLSSQIHDIQYKYKSYREAGYKKFVKNESKIITSTETDDRTPNLLSEMLNKKLNDYGFFNIEMVKQLSKENQKLLVKRLSLNGMPYTIAMFDYLGFFDDLIPEYFKSKKKQNIELAKWFDVDARTIRGNINVLTPYSEENKSRYTSYKYKETVKKDYTSLK